MKTLTKKNTQSKTIDACVSIPEEVQHLLEWSPEQYCWFHYDTMHAFFERRMAAYPTMMNQIITNPTMQTWWRIQEIVRTENHFLAFARQEKQGYHYINTEGEIQYTDGLGTDFLTEEYTYLHSLAVLEADKQFITKFENTLAQIIKHEK